MAVEVDYVVEFLLMKLDRLESRVSLYLSRWQGVVSHLDMFILKLRKFQADLAYIYPHQSLENSKFWLDDLLDSAYNADDVLDELVTCILESELMAKGRLSIGKVRSFIPACFTDSTPDLRMQTALIDITRRFEKLYGDITLDFPLFNAPNHGGIAISFRKVPHPKSLLTQSRIYGRDEDKEKILEMVLNEESNDFNFSVISIVGMRGIGKTRLVQEVYNDKALEGFNIRAWVDVSSGISIDEIHKRLLQQITLSSCRSYGLQEMRIALAKAVIGKSCLFVLDDCWIRTSDAWDFFFGPFKDGAAGSKIIVTTCNVDFEVKMCPSKCYNLNLLTKDACLAIFEEHGSGIRGFNPQRTSPLIREKVVEKIRGLPLAASTLAGMLRFQHRSEWENSLNDRTFNDLYESRIVPVLEITYSHLPWYLKECFAYCAILHEDYEFEEKELVILWVADGLIHPPSVGTKTLKDVGVEYFQALLKRSIFQPSSSNASKFRMHGFFNRLARRISVKRSFKLEEDFIIPERFDKIRYFSYICGNYDRKENFKVLHRMTHLRTFLPIVRSGDSRYLSNMVLFDLLPKLKKLRALSLESYYITMLPDSIGDLKLLRSEVSRDASGNGKFERSSCVI